MAVAALELPGEELPSDELPGDGGAGDEHAPHQASSCFQALATEGLRAKNEARTESGAVFNGHAKFMHWEHRNIFKVM